MSESTPSLAFPHDPLTVISGRPTNSSLQVLKRQMYANAGAINSTRGGAAHGHLALLLPDAEYLVLSNGIPFIPPVHPGPVPVIPANATATQRTEILRLYAQDIADLAVYTRVSTALKKQLLAAVPHTYLQELEDTDFGYLQVTPVTMLNHLMTTYGVITPQELSDNRAKLATSWNPDAPIEDLWRHVENTRRVATAGASPIDDVSTINSLLTMFEKSGLLTTTTEKFRLRTLNEWQMAIFKDDVTVGNKERLRKLTAGTAGYHGAHVATIVPPPPGHSPETAAALAARTNQPPAVTVPVEGKQLYYCWSHGLTPFANHTSLTCTNKKPGHIDTATASNLQGGNTTFRYISRTRHSSGTAPAAPTTAN
jgi:hypothetical protein